ncbi:hypothetical protein [Citrobacter braakii]|nr:hypothetical protein [Citrobacter braakii]
MTITSAQSRSPGSPPQLICRSVFITRIIVVMCILTSRPPAR